MTMTTTNVVAARLRTTSTTAAKTPLRCITSIRPRRRRAAALTAASAASEPSSTGAMVFDYTQVELDTKLGISLHDITPQINACIAKAGVVKGYVNVLSRHTTTGVTINEVGRRGGGWTGWWLW
jgi:hypothetical protein